MIHVVISIHTTIEHQNLRRCHPHVAARQANVSCRALEILGGHVLIITAVHQCHCIKCYPWPKLHQVFFVFHFFFFAFMYLLPTFAWMTSNQIIVVRNLPAIHHHLLIFPIQIILRVSYPYNSQERLEKTVDHFSFLKCFLSGHDYRTNEVFIFVRILLCTFSLLPQWHENIL